MVTKYEIKEYLYFYPEKSAREIAEALTSYGMHNATVDRVCDQLTTLIRHRQIKVHEIKKEKGQIGRPARTFKLSDYAIEVRKKYGSFYKTPSALKTRTMRKRNWTPTGTFFVNIENPGFV